MSTLKCIIRSKNKKYSIDIT